MFEQKISAGSIIFLTCGLVLSVLLILVCIYIYAITYFGPTKKPKAENDLEAASQHQNIIINSTRSPPQCSQKNESVKEVSGSRETLSAPESSAEQIKPPDKETKKNEKVEKKLDESVCSSKLSLEQISKSSAESIPQKSAENVARSAETVARSAEIIEPPQKNCDLKLVPKAAVQRPDQSSRDSYVESSSPPPPPPPPLQKAPASLVPISSQRSEMSNFHQIEAGRTPPNEEPIPSPGTGTGTVIEPVSEKSKLSSETAVSMSLPVKNK